MNNLPQAYELQRCWEELQDIHAQYLEKHGVKLPSADQYNERAKSIWLSVLFFYHEQNVHKNTISDVCQRDGDNLGRDQQVRHLKRDGWRMESDGKGNHKLDPFQPSLEFLNEKTRRDGLLDATSFEDVKRVFGSSCATCGAREGRPDPRYGEDRVVLQQGHRDPEKPSSDRLNIIPQCQFCNRAYRGDFVFDEKGRAWAIADIGPVQRASEAVRQKVMNWFVEKLSGKE